MQPRDQQQSQQQSYALADKPIKAQCKTSATRRTRSEVTCLGEMSKKFYGDVSEILNTLKKKKYKKGERENLHNSFKSILESHHNIMLQTNVCSGDKKFEFKTMKDNDMELIDLTHEE